MLITALFIIVKNWKWQMALNWGMGKCDTAIQWNITQELKGMNYSYVQKHA